MKSSIFALACVFTCASIVEAASLPVTVDSTADGTAWSVFLDDFGVPEYNRISVSLKFPDSQTYENHDADGIVAPITLLRPGDNASFINAGLALPPVFGGDYGWLRTDTENSNTGYVFEVGPLTGNIDVAGPIFLVNVVTRGGLFAGIAEVRLYAGSDEVASFVRPLAGPEPGSVILAAIGVVGISFYRRVAD